VGYEGRKGLLLCHSIWPALSRNPPRNHKTAANEVGLMGWFVLSWQQMGSDIFWSICHF